MPEVTPNIIDVHARVSALTLQGKPSSEAWDIALAEVTKYGVYVRCDRCAVLTGEPRKGSDPNGKPLAVCWLH